jgi:phospho-N-acetylmuramoyl-pentapeptide-transferase
MLYWLSAYADTISSLAPFRYITFRTSGAMITALAFVFLLGPAIIAVVCCKQRQAVHPAGPIILSALLVATLLWANLTNRYVWIVLAVTLAFGAIGFYGDYLGAGATKQSAMSDKGRIAVAASIALAACIALVHLGHSSVATSLGFPFGRPFDLGWFYVPFGALVIVAAGNIVNLAGRLYGSLIGPLLAAVLIFLVIAWLAGNAVFSQYLDIRHVPGTGELAVLCGAAIGAGLGFLWLNARPASTLAGETASLALGGMLGTVAVATKHEVVLVLICCLFVLAGARPKSTMNG